MNGENQALHQILLLVWVKIGMGHNIFVSKVELTWVQDPGSSHKSLSRPLTKTIHIVKGQK